jgi:type I restriction enzyme S subunit
MTTLADFANYVTDKIKSTSISLEQYVTTDSLIQNKRGRKHAENLPPNSCTLTHFRKRDVLISNIRPYLKKIWQADSDGGCSCDVLVFRAKINHSPEYLFAALMQNDFFKHVMKGAKGSKMPRGDKNQIMRFNILTEPKSEKIIGDFIVNIETILSLIRSINHNLEAMAKQLYDYWFVQFDFPNEDGKPYKSSGGKMVWNEKLKRKIPECWNVVSLFDGVSVQYGFPFSTDLFTEQLTTVPIVRIRDIVDNTISIYSKEDTDEKYRLNRGDIIIGMDGNFHINYWHSDTAFLNQRCVRLRVNNESPISALQTLYDVKPYIKAKETSDEWSSLHKL